MTYHVIIFTKENSVEAVPSHWLSRDGKTCAWPKRHLDTTRQIEKKTQPNTLDYTWFEIRVLSNSISSLKEAKEKAKIATFTSDLSSMEEDKKTRNIRRKKIDDDDDDDDDRDFSYSKIKTKKHFKTKQDKILSPPKFIETGIAGDSNDSDSGSDNILFSNFKRSSVAKNRASVSTTASLTSPSLKWNVDDIGLLSSNKTIKKKLDFESISLHSTSPQKDADLHHDNINVDNFSIHYKDGIDNMNGNLKNDCPKKLNVEDKHLNNSITHFSTPSSSVSISNNSTVQTEMLCILKNLTRTLTNLKYEVRTMSTKIERLENVITDQQKNQNNSSTKNNYYPVDENIYKFPLTSLDELTVFEEKIMDKDFRQKMITFLVRLERTTVSDMTRQIMSKLFHNNLLSKFSYSGQKKKMIFSSLNSCALIFETIRTVKSHQNCIDQEILKPMKFFMANAKFREEKKLSKNINIIS
ncbi:unnamed protein product [Macrosiphum euphorbiae]|uniref:DUF4806 domain-containing protein n=1 Tax=Macrosiphum euphorbiae TaxID=13131 RepID=A0AAV0WWV0_9HEMI|nr:unnamed protein product [Macrosiphum euphorbiae]